jgi:hypothetical protein
MKILYKLTTRSRPEKAIRAIQTIIDNANDLNNSYLLCTIDSDDETRWKVYDFAVNNQSLIGIAIISESNNKIDAINRDVDIFPFEWDILVNVSDDQVFIVKGFDDIIRDQFKESLDLFVHFPDGNQNVLSTMSIIGHDYYDRDKYIYHPSYVSVYCDNEAQDVAVIRGCYRFVNNQILDHLHPAWGKSENDTQYKKTEHPTVYNADHENYIKRKSNNFKD